MNKAIIVLTGTVLAAGLSAQAQSTIADWTFETSTPSSAGPFSPEVGSGSALGSHAGASVYSTPAGNGSSHSFSSSVWAVNDYYQIQVSTLGYSGISLSFDQTSSNTGPGKYLLQYSTDGINFNAIGSDYPVLANAAPNTPWNAATPQPAFTMTPSLSSAGTALDNQSTLFFRFVDDSTTSANGGTVATGGTDRMDNIIVTGSAVPEPSIMALFGVGGTFCLGLFRRLKK